MKQDLSQKSQPGSVFMMHLLFKNPVSMPDKNTMTSVMSKHLGDVDCFSFNDKVAAFAAKKYLSEFKDARIPPQLMIMGCNEFDPDTIDQLRKSQMWDCIEDRDRILSECRYQIFANDMMAALPALQRADLDMNFMEALAEIFVDCEAVYFENSGKLFTCEDIRNHNIPAEDRFIYFAVNVRFFNIRSTDDMVIDTLGMNVLYLPDIQYHFHGLDPEAVVNHAYNMAVYIFKNDNPINQGDTIDALENNEMSTKVRWKCSYEDSLIQPSREVIDIYTNQYASGTRE
ncbi:MAG: DUF4261 domain-containing protein [Oscillospiraceae bacterium]|nr:DUF4261 domain-containing protein [Oscillospiraceae bacterium]